MSEPPCWFCHGRPAGATAATLCAAHQQQLEDDLADLARSHPRGLDVHDGCGCVSAAAFMRELEEQRDANN